jgi:hypothetical protein
MKLATITSSSIRRFNLLHVSRSYRYYFDAVECAALANSSLGQQCEVLSIVVKHRINVLDQIHSSTQLK